LRTNITEQNSFLEGSAMNSSDIIREEVLELQKIVYQIIQEEFKKTGVKLKTDDPIVNDRLLSYAGSHHNELREHAVRNLKVKEETTDECRTDEGEIQTHI